MPVNESGEPLVDSESKVHMGNLDASRDWGYAKEYVEAMWLMLQRDEPKDYIIGTGVSHTVRELCQVAFEHVGLNWQDHVVSDPKFMRPTEIKDLVADSSLAKKELNWQPKTEFTELVKLMVDADLQRFR